MSDTPKEVIDAVRVLLGMNTQVGEDRRNARREARSTLRVWLKRIGAAPKSKPFEVPDEL